MVQVRSHHKGPRVYIVGLRLHHGLAGFALAAVGIALALHDRRDFPWVGE